MKTKILLVLTALFVVGCGPKNLRKESQTTLAPTHANDVGLITTNVTESELAQAADKDQRIKVRIINAQHGLFEVFGVNEQELKSALGNDLADIQKNHFLEYNKKEKQLSLVEKLQDLSAPPGSVTEAQARDFLKSCIQNPARAPSLKVVSSAGRDRIDSNILLKLSESVSLNASASVAHDGSAVQTLWVLEPNSDSLLGPQFQLDPLLKFTPDTYGEYHVILFAKDKANVCAMGQDIVYVTDTNVTYNKGLALPEADMAKVDLTRFWHLPLIQAQESWAVSTGENIVVAVVDSGVNYNHPALAANIAVNEKEIAGNKVDDDGNGFVDDQFGYDFGNADAFPFDDDGHGSHVAGLIASPVFGLAKKAKILPVKVGAGSGFDVGSVAGGVFYAVDRGAKVINLSLGINFDFPALRKAIAYAQLKNVVVVAAAGNGDADGNGIDNDVVETFPTNYPSVIAVAATNIKNEKTQYSNFGLKTVHVGAPGGDENKLMLSTYRPTPKGVGLKGQAGTSMASPVVAGLAAQMLAKNPALTPTQVREKLMSSGQELLTLKGKTVSGKLVNALSCLK